MTTDEIEVRLARIEHAIATQDFSYSRLIMLAGEWDGLNKSIGATNEGPWAMLWRTRGI